MKKLIAVIATLFVLGNRIAWAQSSGHVDVVGFTNEITPMAASLVGLYIVDAQGRRTGDDPTRPVVVDPDILWRKCCALHEIPNISGEQNRLDPDDGSGGYGNASITIGGAFVAGSYSIILFSTVTYPVHFMTGLDYGGKSDIASDGILPAGSTVTLTIAYNPEKVADTAVVKTVTFPILRLDLAAAYQVGDVGDKGFVNELDANLTAGENALAHGGRDAHAEAIAALVAFIGGINGALHVDCHEKRPYTNEHRFFTQDMAESFIDDAWTLIVQLGGDDHRPKRGRMRSRS
jgi:hypothetical protein